jgi:hypothetical protein
MKILSDEIKELFDKEFLKKLNYIKVGAYKEELGALSSPTTNQRFYVLKDGEIVEDKTSWFYLDRFNS